MTSFKKPIYLTQLCAIAFAIALAGCATSPSPTASSSGILTANEKAVYQTALNNIDKGDLDKGDLDKAIGELKKISQAHPDFFDGWLNLATAYYHNNKIPEATAALAKAIKLNASVPEVLNLSGLLNVAKADYKAAEKDYLAALALKKDYPAAHYNLANLYDAFYQDINKAIPHYEQYLALTDNTDKNTISWVTELKAKLTRNAN